jgi:type IV pilus assembly protein PilY1
MSTLVDAEGPVSAAPAVAWDEYGRLWIFFGTGRLFNRDDLPQSSPMAIFGVREPESNGVRSWETVSSVNLFDSNKVAVTRGTCGEGEYSENCVGIVQISEGSNSIRDWAWLSSSVDSAAGWKHVFSEAGERSLSQPAVLGGSVLFTSYLPADEMCSAKGTSRLWSLYYKTGTPYFWPSLSNPNGDFPTFIDLGQGLTASPTLHISEKHTLTAFSQSTTGVITDTEIAAAFAIKSGSLFWRKNTE